MTPRPGTTKASWICADKIDAHLRVVRHMAAEHGERVQPHREVVKILAVAIGRFADANAARATEHAIDFRDEPFRLVEVAALFRFGVQRDQQDDAEGIGPQIAPPIGPDAFRAHPGELVEHVSGSLQAVMSHASKTERIGVGKPLEFLGVERRDGRGFVEPDVLVELLAAARAWK